MNTKENGMKKTLFVVLMAIAGIAQAGERIPVPTDSKATYELVSKQNIKGRLLVITKRVGPSGTSFAAREIDCQNATFRYLSEGSSMDALRANVRDTDPMSPLTRGSISTYVAIYACK